jgi:hypothetical protein
MNEQKTIIPIKEDVLHHSFIREIRKKITQSSKLTNILVDLLSIEKEAVYRRLRGEVTFTFHEIAIISKELNISLDRLTGVESSESTFNLKFFDLLEPTSFDYKIIEDTLRVLKLAGEDPFSELVEAANIMPLALAWKYDCIAKLHYFKWEYFHNHLNRQPKLFDDMMIPERLKELEKKYYHEYQNIGQTHFLWDHLIFQYLLNDILYFRQINLLSEENVKLLKIELMHLLDFIEEICTTGMFPTGNKVHICITDVNVSTNYGYVKIKNAQLSIIRMFTLNAIVSTDKRTYEQLRNSIQSIKKASTMISVSGEFGRSQFFEQQRELVRLSL